MTNVSSFDMPFAKRFVEARQTLLSQFLPGLRQQLALESALDAGCGVGYFASFLRTMGFAPVNAFDARPENVTEASRRFSGIQFLCANVEDVAVRQLGSADLVLAMGLLYHLENPFIAIRNLHALTRKVMILETVCTPETRPVLYLRDEFENETQSLHSVSFYPSEGCVIKMCYRAGFPFLFKSTRFPAHEDFHATISRKRCRTILVASNVPISNNFLIPTRELFDIPNPLLRGWANMAKKLMQRVHFA